jgi:ribosome-associated translation inhibitor RaiA
MNEKAVPRLSLLRQTKIFGGMMLIEVSTDNTIEGREKLNDYVKGVVDEAMSRFAKRITRVEVHISDVNGHKSGVNDIRCVMEARLEGRPPIAVTSQETTMDEAVDGAAGKLKRLIESTLSRESSLAGQRDHR